MAGVAVIVGGGWGDNDKLVAAGVAVGSGVAYAGVLIGLRVLRDSSSRWLTIFNHLFAAVALAPSLIFCWKAAPSPAQLVTLGLFGSLQMGLPYWLVARGLRRVGAQEAGMLTLLEPLFNPLWAFLVYPSERNALRLHAGRRRLHPGRPGLALLSVEQGADGRAAGVSRLIYEARVDRMGKRNSIARPASLPMVDSGTSRPLLRDQQEATAVKKVGIFWPGDYRAKPNEWAAPQANEATEQLRQALRKLGREPYVVPGFLTRPDEAITKLGPLDDPLIGVFVHWAYAPHTCNGVAGKDNPLLLASNFSGTWPGLVALLNTGASLESINRRHSRIWTDAGRLDRRRRVYGTPRRMVFHRAHPLCRKRTALRRRRDAGGVGAGRARGRGGAQAARPGPDARRHLDGHD